jgi:4-diphosphocytidyl-2-C-methyl-D-erythritol kinase
MGTDRVRVTEAPAKINLFLEVMGRRPDGYHTLSTIFQEISLADRLTVRPDLGSPGGTFRLSVKGAELPADGNNLVLRAAEAFHKMVPVESGRRILLEKRIPMGAGLGGGSSDAAATLKALWTLSGRAPGAFPPRRFLPAARRLGADVPFFLMGGRAWGRGIGDRLTPLPVRERKPYYFVLVSPETPVPTPWVYKHLRFPLTKRRTSLTLQKMLRAARPAAEWAPMLFNRLEEVVLPRVPAVREARAALERAGCRAALMSGSGSSVFGVVDSPSQGRRVLSALPRGRWAARLVRSMS